MHKTGEPLQLSLFKNYLESEFNALEKKDALYLDEQEALKWWHRIAARRECRLQGWRKHGVFPDFVVLSRENGTLVLLETKGEHLEGNKDTVYKKKLFEILERSARCRDVGEMTAMEEGGRASLRILMGKSWKDELKKIV